jgi:hypothetical protein
VKIDALTLVILALAVHRVTRLIVTDTIFEKVRDWLRSLSMTKKPRTQRQSGEMMPESWVPKTGAALVPRTLNSIVHCHWCASIYVSAGTLALYRFEGGWFMWIAKGLAFSTVAGVLHERS